MLPKITNINTLRFNKNKHSKFFNFYLKYDFGSIKEKPVNNINCTLIRHDTLTNIIKQVTYANNNSVILYKYLKKIVRNQDNDII